MAKAVSLGPMTVMPSGATFFLGGVFRSALFPLCSVLFLGVMPSFWSDNGGAGGVTSLLRGVALESRACQSVMVVIVVARKVEDNGRYRCGEEGGGLAEGSR
jgi:hypothetical protein